MVEGGVWTWAGPNLRLADGFVDLGRRSDVMVSPGRRNVSETIPTMNRKEKICAMQQ